ncbi:MAG: endonuclease/exonuclease/phosphatase family protein [Saprospiraceae bacterium]|nr:endonuclease/exonuclease/phosphatase family protein [Saprospiraceae bacterium]
MSKLYISMLLGILLSFSGSIYSQSLGDISFGTDSTFDVVTWNIEQFPKIGSITADSVSKIIESLDADLIGLQEIEDTAICRQMINNLADYELIIDDGWFGGLAYVYKKSTVNIRSLYKIYHTSSYWNVFPRSPLVVELTFMGKDFVVINNHLKCCGDGFLDNGNSSDEEFRRYQASFFLEQYIDFNFASSPVILLGDLNDLITDPSPNNVFEFFLSDPANYLFADNTIANGPSSNWSFPGWPSHLDHILITNELFSDFNNPGSTVETIKIDAFMTGGFGSYDYYISDHRPVGLKLRLTSTISDLVTLPESKIAVFPNPMNGKLSVDLTQWEEAANVTICDINGRVVYAMLCQGNQVTSFDFNAPKGVYILSAESGNRSAVIRLVNY